MAQLYTWRALASILGSMLFGHLNDVIGGPLVLGLCLVGQGSMSLLTPWCPELSGLSIIQAISAFFTNGINTGEALSICLPRKSGLEVWIGSLDRKSGSEVWLGRLARKAGSEGWLRRLGRKSGLEGWL